ncbi:hypothetical protein EDB81DRAFT_777775 [Dactylonectria macrodidyma]|uniref:Uncharacterized protein n=1 Tax=Dactylonectria macrodidyma TaxID=307937 RepID=A0A9P9FPL8_9HYPO|nr:hypothetical protein EDB81DRAFT_777775 [Dactylonectria macrodidyma]
MRLSVRSFVCSVGTVFGGAPGARLLLGWAGLGWTGWPGTGMDCTGFGVELGWRLAFSLFWHGPGLVKSMLPLFAHDHGHGFVSQFFFLSVSLSLSILTMSRTFGSVCSWRLPAP